MARDIAVKAEKLDRFGVNGSALTWPPRGHDVHELILKTFQRMRAQIATNSRWVGRGIDRATDQNKGARRLGRLNGGEKRRCRKHRHHGLTHADDVDTSTEHTNHFGNIQDLLFKPETACFPGHVTDIEPIGHRHRLAVPKQIDNEIPEQDRKTSRKRRDHEDWMRNGYRARKFDQVGKGPPVKDAFGDLDAASYYAHRRNAKRPAGPWIAEAPNGTDRARQCLCRDQILFPLQP